MTKIKELKEKDRLTLNLLVKNVVKGSTNSGAAYATLTLQDDTGSIEGKYWDLKPEDFEEIKVGEVQEVTFEVIDYKGKNQLKVLSVKGIDQSSIDIYAYAPSSSLSESFVREKYKEILNSFSNEKYRILVQGVFEIVGKKFLTHPAASKIHHGYLGGLAEHTLSMVDVANFVASHYPHLNRDLLIAGVLVHDLGKTYELQDAFVSEYTLEGKLTGHISIGHGWIMEVAQKHGLQDSEESFLLRHMLLSHHGKLEYGSPVVPMTPEAEALNLIDNLDARMNTIKHALDEVAPGEFTQRLFALDNRQFYKDKSKE